jgi:hypothetical protein
MEVGSPNVAMGEPQTCRSYVDRIEVGHYAWGFVAGESPRERLRRRATVR